MTAILYQHDDVFEGFTIRFEALPELEDVHAVIEGTENPDEVLADIQNYRVLLFVARVTARRAGIELAETFLGGRLYATYADFIGDDYYSDLRREVVGEAKIKLQLLQIPDQKRTGVKV